MKFKQMLEARETERESSLYSKQATELYNEVESILKKKLLTREDKQDILNIMLDYGQRRFMAGIKEGDKEGTTQAFHKASRDEWERR